MPTSDKGLAAVMSPGNFESPIDVLHKLFLDGQVCVVKSHPGNASSMDLVMSSLFHRLVADGFVGLASGGPAIGGKLLNGTSFSVAIMLSSFFAQRSIKIPMLRLG